MRFILVSVCLFFLVFSSLLPQSNWQWINPSPTPHPLNSAVSLSDSNKVYFPLDYGNTQQMFYRNWSDGGSPSSYSHYNVVYRSVGMDSVFNNGKRYNYYLGFFIRYDTLANIVYANYQDSDYVYINFSLPVGTSYSMLASPNSTTMRTVKVIQANITVMDTTFAAKGYSWEYRPGTYDWSRYYDYFAPDVGWVWSDVTHTAQHSGSSYTYSKAIQVIVKGNHPIGFFDDNASPVMKYPSVVYPSFNSARFKIVVDHKFSRLTYSSLNTGYCFVDSVWGEVFLSNGTDTVGVFSGILQKENEVTFLTGIFNMDSLMHLGYNLLLYSVSAKDKGLLPHYSIYPSEGLGSIRLINQYYANPDAFLYPLSGGNMWLYKKYTVSSEGGLIFNSYVRSVITGDTVLSNGISYYILRDFDDNIFYDRLDTLSGNVYRAKFTNNALREVLLDSLSAPLNSSFYAHRFSPDTLVIITQFDSTYRTIASSVKPRSYYSLKDNLGIVAYRKYFTNVPGSLGFYYELIAARINGKWWGDSTLLDGRDLGTGSIQYSLSQNYPNPFNPTTVISYGLQVTGRITLKLFDLLGNEVATLVDEEQPAGTHEYKLSTLNYKLSSGVYFYQLRAGTFVTTKKMVLLK
ncbi:MAG: T9SS type A sorting domain-containing protein [Ignavibacteriaceae bacterium]